MWQGQGPFGAFGEGKGLLGVSDTWDDVMDRIRYWAEECDTFQVRLFNKKQHQTCNVRGLDQLAAW